jgi:hypothetical protein
MKHIEFAQLVERFEGRVSETEEREITAHIDDCTGCNAEFRKLAAFFTYTEPKEFESVPQAVTARILNTYQRKPGPAVAPEPKRRSLISLIFDDWQMAVNERYSGLDSRQMLYHADEFEIDLRIELVGDKCRLTGQLFPASSGATAEISSADVHEIAELNEFGEFIFDPVHQGVYDFRVSVGTEILDIENIPLQH